MMKRIFVRWERCTACKTCQVACMVEHSAAKDLFAAMFETPRPRTRVYVEAVNGSQVPIFCRHCDDAPCLNACIAGALYRDEATGAVLSNLDRCIGCWTCVMVCPYGVVTRQLETQRALKCDLCPNRDVPACVAACPTSALVYAEADDVSRQRRQALATAVAGAPGG
jgi:carbon-monoxide dehydrogenase iron sulfur subunit